MYRVIETLRGESGKAYTMIETMYKNKWYFRNAHPHPFVVFEGKCGCNEHYHSVWLEPSEMSERVRYEYIGSER